MTNTHLPLPKATCNPATKSRSLLAWLSLIALLAFGSHGHSEMVNCTWTGEAGTDLMSEQSNWQGAYTPADEAINFRDIVFGPLPDGAHQTVGVDTDRNLGPIIFAEGAPPMTLRAAPPNEGRIRLAHTSEPLRIVNRSGQTQTFQISLHVIWQDQPGVPVRQFEAAAGDIVFDRMTVLCGEVPAAGANAKEAVWQLSGSSDMLFSAVIMATDSWPGETSLSMLKTGSGRVVFNGETRWRGSGTVEEGVVVVDGLWEVSGDISISPVAALEGKGQIESPVRVQGKLSPGGAEIATLKFGKGLELSGTTDMALDAEAGTSDCVSVSSGPLTYGRELRVATSGQSKFRRGQIFRLFEWTGQPPTGSFTKVELPPLPSGLRWTDKLSEDGTIVVGP